MSTNVPAIAPANLPAPDQDAQTLNLTTEAKCLTRDLADLQVHDDDSDARAAQGLVDARRVYAGLEARRKALKEPALEYGRKVDSYYKAAQDPLEVAADALKLRSRDYKLRVAAEAEKRQREAEKRAAEAAAEAERLRREQEAAAAQPAGGAAPAPEVDPFDVLAAQMAAEQAAAIAAQPAAAPVTKHYAAGGGSAGLKKVAKWELVDLAAVPREFLVLDEKRINAIVRDAKLAAPDTVKIPGIRVFLEDEMAVRR